MKSSGTSGANSKIYLDYLTSFLQSKALIKILKNYFGDKGYSLLLLSDIPSRKKLISASTAGSLGFSLNASDIYYVFKNGKIDVKNIKNFLKKKNKKILFGFTFEVWNFFKLNQKYLKENKINFLNCNLLHGGGWKKIIKNKVSETMFDNYLKKNFKFSNIINYYGLVEQTGSIFMQCEKNRHFHTSDFSEIIIRDNNFNSIINKKGVVQLFSLLPFSYPGHNIVTRDIGKIIGEDDCSCGRKGKYFKIYGRLKDSEVRGCSDTIK